MYGIDRQIVSCLVEAVELAVSFPSGALSDLSTNLELNPLTSSTPSQFPAIDGADAACEKARVTLKKNL